MRRSCASAVCDGGAASVLLLGLLPTGATPASRCALPAPTKPSSCGHTANNASGGGAHLVAHTSARKFGEWGGGLQVHRKPEHSSGDGRRGEAGGRALRTCGFAPCSSRLGAVKQCSPMHSHAWDCKSQKATIVS